MTEFFKNLTDNDFLSDKLTHIYFNDIVDDKSVNKLIEDIRNANKNIEQNGVIIKPKPILIHINSKGGSVYDGMRFLSIFNISSVPIATMIDNYSFSAATFLSIHSPYRVMTKYSLCLLHYYSVTFYNKIKRERLFTELTELENYFSKIIDMYLKNTKIKKEELHDLLQHDLFINYKFCLEKGIVDRVIDFNHPPVILKRNIYDIIKDEKTIKNTGLTKYNGNKKIDLDKSDIDNLIEMYEYYTSSIKFNIEIWGKITKPEMHNLFIHYNFKTKNSFLIWNYSKLI